MENEHINTLVSEVQFSARLKHCFHFEEIETLGDLASKTGAELLRIPNFGLKSLKETEEILALFGLNLQEKVRRQERIKPKKWFVGCWMPISSAPKDGTEILASQAGFIDVVAWRERPYGFFEANGVEMQPDHWMRLPWPPEGR